MKNCEKHAAPERKRLKWSFLGDMQKCDTKSLEVAVVTACTGHNSMYCHRYHTRACATGNGEVRSLWDNVASSILDGQEAARWIGDC